MFTPQPTSAQEWLKDRKEPGKAIEWWPTAAWVACDGSLAVDTGGWKRPDGAVGYFTTVWKRQPDGSWRWIVDGGDALKLARAPVAKPRVRRAACGRATPLPVIAYREGPSDQRTSPDGTLAYRWHVSGSGARTFEAWLWNGRAWEQVIADRIAAAT